MTNLYDLVILGGGPAGLSAGVYAGRAGLKTVIVEKGLIGGQLQNTEDVENYPGIRKTTGPELSEVMGAHPKDFDVEEKYGEVQSLQLTGEYKIVDLGKEKLTTRAILIATGATPRKLGVPGEAELSGRGVSYCAICDGAFFKNKELLVIGGGDSAVEEGNFLTRFASKVTIVHRRDKLRATPILQQKAMDNPKVDFVWNHAVESIEGGRKVETVVLRNTVDGSKQTVKADGIFIYVGLNPNTDFLKESSILDEHGYIVTNEEMETSIPGVFAAGDVRQKKLRQIITAASDGAIAAMNIYEYIENKSSITVK
ncbi:thioredoxin-disulfide reductase [Aneurinibacillus sp. Ricciae_BoGa-3]|uniref:thioredoxin-disulfide reductase n=1 Tax=Aneurinibacillus sp. Ricciae_BoGa-3 TaxID=3022697 RepID=UPI00233FE2E6|nr:thioredoxin-disulfide reductase [Aneurinibacillus sp. Ricciae_BoGa-3]WCK52963.1 thioredoxin-disulfide reductase [Aneurinibacillus sp. Ricciae_BoGa-3]